MNLLITVMVIICQWNARSLLANGQEFKHFIKEMNEKPDVMCVQETWLKPSLDFVLHGYTMIRRDRNQGGGEGCATFVKQNIPYKIPERGADQEYVVVEVWEREERVVIINYYNPCKRLDLDSLLRIRGQDRRKIIWCADFNAHSTVFGGVTNRCKWTGN